MLASELPHVAEGLREQALWYSTRQTGNKHFVCSLSGFSINVADLFLFTGTNWGNPVPKFNGIAWVFYFDFLDEFWL